MEAAASSPLLPSLLLHWGLASVVLFAAVSKASRSGWGRFKASVRKLTRLPVSWVSPVAASVILAEGTVAAALVSRYPTPAVGPIAFIGLLTAFTVVVIAAVGRNELASCACFGRHSTAPLSLRTIVRNFALMGVAGLALFIDDQAADFDAAAPGVLAVVCATW